MEPEGPVVHAPREASFRASARPPLVPIAGGRAVQLERTMSAGSFAMLAVWMTGIVAATSVSFLEGMVPDAALGVIALGVILVALAASFTVQRRIRAARTRWVVHFDAELTALEDRQTGAATELNRENTSLGVHTFTARGGRYSVPTIVVELVPPRIVIGAPPGIVSTSEHTTRTGAPAAIAADQAAWDALRFAASRPAD